MKNIILIKPDQFTKMDIMPFGKYKGKPINSIPQEYKGWLKLQPWVREKFPLLIDVLNGIDNTSVSFRLEKDDSPEHNRFQAKFMDDKFVKKFIQLIYPKTKTKINKYRSIYEKQLTEFAEKEYNEKINFEKEKYKQDMEKYLKKKNTYDKREKDHKKIELFWNKVREDSWENIYDEFQEIKDDYKSLYKKYERKKERFNKTYGYNDYPSYIFPPTKPKPHYSIYKPPKITDIWEESKFTIDVNFEIHNGSDVGIFFEFNSGGRRINNEREFKYPQDILPQNVSKHGQILIELKPILGDDYPSVMRQIKNQRERYNSCYCKMVLFIDNFQSDAIDRKQLATFFSRERIIVKFLDEIE